jgi:uncharacterized protein YjiS (DUF1127 family)
MNTFANANIASRRGCGVLGTMGVAIRSAVTASIAWRVQQAAIAYLSAMSDRELRDIGLVRSEIELAVNGERARR